MKHRNYRAHFAFALCLLMLGLASEAEAQEFNEEMKRKLRESLTAPELNPPSQKIQPIQIRPQRNNPDEVLKVSPTTKLPTRFDRIEILHPLPETGLSINMKVTNLDISQSGRSKIDYSTGKVHAIPDSRSISQWAQNTRNDYGLGLYVPDEAPDWMKKIRKFTNSNYQGFDADPVRAIQRHKARKRQEKVNKIIKAYE